MKKLYLLLMLCVFSCVAWSCSDNDDDKDTPISLADLPNAARTFISKFVPDDEVVRVVKEVSASNVQYDVRFRSGLEIEFDAAGNWTDVDAPKGQTVPTGIVPVEIQKYIDTNYNAIGVNEISVDARGNYEVELLSGVDLLFDADGNFIRVDN